MSLKGNTEGESKRGTTRRVGGLSQGEHGGVNGDCHGKLPKAGMLRGKPSQGGQGGSQGPQPPVGDTKGEWQKVGWGHTKRGKVEGKPR